MRGPWRRGIRLLREETIAPCVIAAGGIGIGFHFQRERASETQKAVSILGKDGGARK